MNWYFEVWKKYANFGGRAGRQEYWYFVLFNILANILLGILAAIIGAKIGMSLLGLYSLAVVIPSLAVSVRRLHDNGRSGWWLLISLIPAIGPILLLIFLLQGSQESENQYGPRPAAALA
jgi:uncharacterized membrane protein YhaH (DUF805 family)